YEGAAAMRGVTTALGRYLRTVHLVSTHRATIADDRRTATGATYCVAHHLTASSDSERAGDDLVMTIRYDDQYACDAAGAWRFAARECHKLFVRTERVEHLGPR